MKTNSVCFSFIPVIFDEYPLGIANGVRFYPKNVIPTTVGIKSEKMMLSFTKNECPLL